MGRATIAASGADALLARGYECIEKAPTLEAVILELRDILGVKHLVYHAARFGARSIDDPFIRLTYPAEWVKRYLTHGYMNIDPTVREGFKRTLPFDWSEFVGHSAEEMAFFMDAIQHDVGPNGMSIPLISREGHRALFSLCAEGTPEAWRSWKEEHLSVVIEMANRLHQRAIATIFETILEKKPAVARLAPREIECLHWVAQGKDTVDVAIILGLSQHTVRTYLKAARFKLGCATIAQAVHKASQLGLIQA